MLSNDDDALLTTTQFQTMPRPAAVVVTSDAPATETATIAAPTAAPPVSTRHVQQTSSKAFADALLSTQSTHTRAASQRTSSPATVDRAQSDVSSIFIRTFG